MGGKETTARGAARSAAGRWRASRASGAIRAPGRHPGAHICSARGDPGCDSVSLGRAPASQEAGPGGVRPLCLRRPAVRMGHGHNLEALDAGEVARVAGEERQAVRDSDRRDHGVVGPGSRLPS